MEELNKIERALKISIIEGLGAVVFSLLTQGFIFTKIALEFGADEIIIGFALGLQLLGQIFQLLVPHITRRLGRRKPLIVFLVSVSRFSWILLIILSLLGIVSSNFFIIIVGLSFALGSMAGNAWTNWMRRLVPAGRMGRFFGLRNVIHSFTSLVFTWLFSAILNRWPNMTGVRTVIVIGLAGAVFSVFFLSKQYEPPMKLEERNSNIKFSNLIKDKNLKNLLFFGMFWNFTILFTSPFFSFHQIKNLHVPFSTLGYLSIISGLVTITFFWIWGKVSDSIGHKNVLRIGISFAVSTSAMWFFMTPQTMNSLLWIDAGISGIAWSAINLTLFTIPIIVSGEMSSVFIGWYAALGGISGFAGSVVGGFVTRQMTSVTFSFLGLDMQGIQFVFLTGGILRFIALLLVSRIEIEGTVKVSSFLIARVNGMSRKIFRDIFEPVPRQISLIRNLGNKKRTIHKNKDKNKH